MFRTTIVDQDDKPGSNNTSMSFLKTLRETVTMKVMCKKEAFLFESARPALDLATGALDSVLGAWAFSRIPLHMQQTAGRVFL